MSIFVVGPSVSTGVVSIIIVAVIGGIVVVIGGIVVVVGGIVVVGGGIVVVVGGIVVVGGGGIVVVGGGIGTIPGADVTSSCSCFLGTGSSSVGFRTTDETIL